MSKSPINFGGIAGIAADIRGGRGRKKLSGRINKLENQMQTVMRDRNKNYDMSADSWKNLNLINLKEEV